MHDLIRAAPLDGEILRHADIRVLATLSPLGQSRVEKWVPSGLTISEIVARTMNNDFCLVSIEGHIIPRENWHRVRPKPGITVFIRALAGPPIAAAFAAIAGAIGAFQTFITGMGFFGQLIMAGISLGVKLLLSALFPPPKPPELAKPPKEAYSFTGARNQPRPFDTVPVILGKHRVSPDFGGLPYTEIKGDDQYLRALFIVGMGPIDITDIRIGETPYTEFDEVTIQIKEGWASDTKQTLYPEQVLEEFIDATLEGPPWDDITNYNRVTHYTASDIDTITLNFYYPQGLIRYGTAGDKRTLTSTLKIRYRTYPGGGTWTNVPDLTITKKTQDPIRIGTTWDVTGTSQWEVEIYREQPEPDPDDKQTRYQTVIWGSMQGFRSGAPVTFSKPLALIAMKIKATGQLSGTLDNVNCIAQSFVAKSWNGTSWVNNVVSRYPHDLFRHVLQGAANARPKTDAELDLVSLQNWGTYCINQGFRCNRPLSEPSSVFDTLQQIASCGRAAVIFKDGKWSVVWDEQSTPIIQMFTPRNSWGFEARHEYIDVPHALRIQFPNEQKRYVQDEHIVYDDGYAAVAGGGKLAATKFEGLEFPGVTHEDLIWRHGRFQIAQMRLQPASYRLNTDFEHLKVTRNDRVRIQHDVMLVGIGAARVKTVSGQSVTMDEQFLLTGITYQMRFRLNDGTYLVRDLAVGQTGFLSTLLFSGTGTMPVAGNLGVLGPSGTESAVYRVKSIEPQEDLSALLTMVDDAPAIYTADTGTIPPFNSNVTAPVNYYALSPQSPVVLQSNYQQGNIVYGQVIFSWTAPPYGEVNVYNTQIYDDGVWLNGPSASAPTSQVTIRNLAGDTYRFRVRARFKSGDVSNWKATGNVNMNYLSTPPDSVTNFRIATTGSISTLTWSPVPQCSYEIRFVASGGTVAWNNGLTIATGLTATTFQTAAVVGSYMIKAVNSHSVKSLAETIITTNISAIAGVNVVSTITESPGFAGTKTNTTVTGGILKLTAMTGGVQPEGYYQFAATHDLSVVYTSRLSAVVSVVGEDVTNVMSTWTTLAGVAALDTSTQSSWSVDLEMQTSQDASVFTGWIPFTAGDVTARAFKFRAKLTGHKADPDDLFATVTPAVSLLRIIIDMPDRVVAGNNLVSGTSGSGLVVTFDPDFKALHGIGIAAQNMLTGDRAIITAKTVAGFTIRFTDSAGTTVSRTFDYVAKGYGSVV